WETVVVWVLVGMGVTSLIVGTMDLLAPRRRGQTRWLEAWSGRLATVAVLGLLVFVALPSFIVLLRNHRFVVPHHPGWSIGGVLGFVLSIIGAVVVELRAGRASTPGATVVGAVATRAKALVARLGPKLRSAFSTFVGGLIGPLAVLLTFVQFVLLGSRGPTTMTAWFLIISGVFVVAIWQWGDLTS